MFRSHWTIIREHVDPSQSYHWPLIFPLHFGAAEACLYEVLGCVCIPLSICILRYYAWSCPVWGRRAIHLFIHLVVCLTTGPKRALHIVRTRLSSVKWAYPLLFLRSSSSFLRLLLRLLVTFIPPFISPSATCCRWQFVPRMWPIQLAIRLRISCRIFLCSLTLSNTSSFLTWSVQLIFSNLHSLYMAIPR